jgi:hypothetical protein
VFTEFVGKSFAIYFGVLFMRPLSFRLDVSVVWDRRSPPKSKTMIHVDLKEASVLAELFFRSISMDINGSAF